MIEEWKLIPGYEEYQVSNLGRVRRITDGGGLGGNSWKKGRIKNIQTDGHYCHVYLYRDGNKKAFKIHRLVLMSFDRMPIEGEEGNHINGNKRDNCAKNLEWVTHSENELHAHRTGLNKGRGCPGRFGILHPLHKLHDGEVFLIKKLISSRKISHSAIAKMFKVSQTEISRIGRGARWPHIETPINNLLPSGNGFCQCGCGQKTRIAWKDRVEFGWIKGEPLRFLRGHGTRVFKKEADNGKVYHNPISRFVGEIK